MENLELLQTLFDNKKIEVINVFLQNREKQFYLQELSKESKIPIATVYRILKQLVDLKIVNQINVSKFKLYQISDSEQALFLSSILKQKKKALQEFVDKIKVLNEVSLIILHGEESETRANVLIIGDNISAEKVKGIASDIKDKYEFIVTHMNMTPAQYEQMSSIGLLSRQKRILFEKKPP